MTLLVEAGEPGVEPLNLLLSETRLLGDGLYLLRLQLQGGPGVAHGGAGGVSALHRQHSVTGERQVAAVLGSHYQVLSRSVWATAPHQALGRLCTGYSGAYQGVHSSESTGGGWVEYTDNTSTLLCHNLHIGFHRNFLVHLSPYYQSQTGVNNASSGINEYKCEMGFTSFV